jgi:serine O-acetyltransferase
MANTLFRRFTAFCDRSRNIYKLSPRYFLVMGPIYQTSAAEPDWSREQVRCWWDPARQLLRSVRRYQLWRQRGWWGKAISKYYVLTYRFWSVVTGADIPLNAQLGGGLILVHPNGVVIHPNAVVGPNCLILQQVTLVEGVRLGGHVDIGAGAKIIRPVTIGDHAQIGANAVVLCDVPAGATAVGIPAKIVLPKGGSFLKEFPELADDRDKIGSSSSTGKKAGQHSSCS